MGSRRACLWRVEAVVAAPDWEVIGDAELEAEAVLLGGDMVVCDDVERLLVGIEGASDGEVVEYVPSCVSGILGRCSCGRSYHSEAF